MCKYFDYLEGIVDNSFIVYFILYYTINIMMKLLKKINTTLKNRASNICLIFLYPSTNQYFILFNIFNYFCFI